MIERERGRDHVSVCVLEKEKRIEREREIARE